MSVGWVALAGLVVGFIAGFAARFGHLCTMGAVEAWIVSRDGRGMKAWGLALAVAIAAVVLGEAAGYIDLGSALYRQTRIDILSTLLGGLVFGIGMANVGTCSFGVLVRAGGGDLRALVTAPLVGIAAFSLTGGVLSPLRDAISGHVMVDLASAGAGDVGALAASFAGGSATTWRLGLAGLIGALLVAVAVSDRALWRRRRLPFAAMLLGVAVALGWLLTSLAVERLELDRVESLTFVAPVGRLLLQIMIEPMRGIEFGAGSVIGVVLGSAAVACVRDELRFEAFDDAREMRRHLIGAVLMGFGGVLARGCSIGQGLSGGSTLALTMPLFVVGALVGAKLGLDFLLEGRLPWHRLRARARDG
ncbi:MAG: YeeE/YedE family protein [Hyphomicrobiaceae bacterium]